MKRTNYIIFAVIAFVLTLGSCNSGNQSGQTDVLDNDSTELKKRIDSAQLLTYTDKTYDVTIPYPDFFDASDTTEAGTAHICYPSFRDKEIILTMFVEPNIEGWNIKEAVEQLSDSANICLAEGKDFFIMEGKVDKKGHGLFLEKCYLLDDNWIDYTVYYRADHKNAVGRLIDMVKEWEP